jgi:hypothetical protein
MMILPKIASGSTLRRQRVATLRRKIRHSDLVITGSTMSAARKDGIIFLTFTA